MELIVYDKPVCAEVVELKDFALLGTSPPVTAGAAILKLTEQNRL